MRFAQVHAEKAQFTVQALCDALDVSTSGYYAWAKRRPSRTNRRANRTRQVDAVRQAFHRSRGRYGSRRVHAELRARGHRISRRSVEELMRDQGLVARPRRRFKATTDSTHADPIAPNLLKRDFTASRPDQVWVGDVTAIATLEGWLFLAVLIDLHSRRVVGWSTSVANDRHLALDALAKARQDRRPGPGIIVHSDRGSPYASDDYRKALAAMGARPSMSRSGDCWDNAVAESFFSSAKTELAIRRPLASFRVAEALIADYINHFYNPVRLHSTVGYMSPVAYELRSRATALAA